MEFLVEVEEHGLTMASVRLNGWEVGLVSYEASYRAPKRWSACTSDAAEIGRFTSMVEAAFAIASHAHGNRMKTAILAKLGDAQAGA